ncbi:MAG: hypothetical protein ABIF40_01950 [archaeon]
MEKVKSLLKESNSKIRSADHLLTMTYPVIQDPKMLAVITQNIYTSMTSGMKALLYYDRLYKRIGPLSGDFWRLMDVFRRGCCKRYQIEDKYCNVIVDLKQIMEKRQASTMEFVRKDKFVICSNDYKMSVLNVKKVKEYLLQAKEFNRKLNLAIK